MDIKVDNISQIRMYLTGQLDARAMHRMEQYALNDPFLTDALEGYQLRKDQLYNLEDLKQRLQERIYLPKRKTPQTWLLIIAIIAVVSFAVVGAWWLLVYMPQLNKQNADRAKHNTIIVKPSVEVDKLQPGNGKSSNFTATSTDTTRTDSATQKSKVTSKKGTIKADSLHKKQDVSAQSKNVGGITPNQQSKGIDPNIATVHPSTIIADLNKKPYSLVKPKGVNKTDQQSKDNDPNIATVHPSTIIADLNKKPYSLVKPKTLNTANQQKADNADGAKISQSAATGKGDMAVKATQSGPNGQFKLEGNGRNTETKPNAITPPATQLQTNTSKPIPTSPNKVVTTGGALKSDVTIGSNSKLQNKGTLNQGPADAAVTNKQSNLNSYAGKVGGQGVDDITIPQGKKEITGMPVAIKADAINKNYTPVLNKTNAAPDKNNSYTVVTGQVLTAGGGKPIPGVAVKIAGTLSSVFTDANGRFKISVPNGQKLDISSLGYGRQQLTPGSGDIKIAMQPSLGTSDEVITNSPDTGKDQKLVNKKTKEVAISLKNGGPPMHVTGKVLSLLTNAPVPYVVMYNKNAEEQYRLESDGVFDIVVHKNDEIFVSRNGFKLKKIKIKNNVRFNIILEENNSSLFDGFVRGPNFNPFDDAAHPSIGWDKFKAYQKIKATDGKTGTIKIKLTINADDSVSDVKVDNSVSKTVDAQAVSIVQDKIKWVHNGNNEPETITVKFKVE